MNTFFINLVNRDKKSVGILNEIVNQYILKKREEYVFLHDINEIQSNDMIKAEGDLPSAFCFYKILLLFHLSKE